MAKAFVAQLTLEEKCNMTSGVKGPCVGNVLSVLRLNFTGLCFQDAPSGVGDGVQRSTAFPPGIQIAATWDRDLFYKRAVAIGEEVRSKGVHFALGPMMNIDRNARHGRNWEGFGADPYLSGENAFYYVQGLQDQGVVATAKHYICNEQETHRSSDASRNRVRPDAANYVAYSANLDDKTMHEIYLWPFASSVAAGVGSVMCSYNRVNGTPACQNKRTLNELLKEELDFLGNVMSDWGATKTGVESVLGGLDIDMPGGDGLMGSALVSAVQKGTIPEARIDDMITRILAPYYLLGQDQGYPMIDLDQDAIGDHYKINRQIGMAGIILLKNINHVLPFNVTTNYSFLVYGEAAGRSKHGFGDAGLLQLGGALYQGGGSGYVEPTYAVDPLTSLLSKARKSHLQIRYITNQLDVDVINASFKFRGFANAKCLVFISAFSSEGFDRLDLHAADNGDLLVRIVASGCAQTIVIVNSVSQLNLEAWIDHPHVVGVVWSGLPGSEYGPALVDLDISKTEEGQYIASSQYRQHRARSYANIGISRFYEPIYEITFVITNTGKVYGSEVPQLYLGFPSEAEEPPKVLRGFERVYLAAGESKQVSLVLTQKDISYWNVVNQIWTIARGTYTVWISTSANNSDVKLQSSFTI
ncbi:unnamed protein product [Rotaria sp. Silwood1]|nr:unnamed protein product [Rotaria sp. Silwood1]